MANSIQTPAEFVATLKPHEPSIIIPRVFPNITWKRVKEVFEESTELGIVDRIDMPKRTNAKGEEYRQVYVHFKSWNDTDVANKVRQKLCAGENIKIEYDTPWFWKISKSKVDKPAFEKPKPKAQKPKATRPKFGIIMDDQERVDALVAENASLKHELARVKAELSALRIATTDAASPASPVYDGDAMPTTPTYA
jgi:hypothetical protein